MKQIALSGKKGRGKFALVDDEDYEWINQYKWHITAHGYANSSSRALDKNKRRMHKLITGYNATDHIDRNRLNNQRVNLRETTRSQNQANITKSIKRGNTSKYKGVCKHGKNFTAYVTKDHKRYCLGSFTIEEDAAKTADRKAIELFGEFANTNFDKEIYKNETDFFVMKNGSSRYRHISFNKKDNRWKAEIRVTRTYYKYLGYFLTEKEAIEALQEYQTDLYYEILDEQTTLSTSQSEDNTENSTECLKE